MKNANCKLLLQSLLLVLNYCVDAAPSSQPTGQPTHGAREWFQVGVSIDGEGAGDLHGRSVSLSSDGNRVAIGAPSNDGGGEDSGNVRVFEYDSSSWTQLGADIDGLAAGEHSGLVISLSSDGRRVAIGSPGREGVNVSSSSHVRVYKYGSYSWFQLGADISGHQGSVSVSLSSDGSRVAIGSRGNVTVNGTFVGLVRVFEYSSGSWSQLGADIYSAAADDWFGWLAWPVSLSSDGEHVACIAHSNGTGLTRVYGYNASSWVQLGTDIDGGTSLGNQSEYTIALSADGSSVATGVYVNLLAPIHVMCGCMHSMYRHGPNTAQTSRVRGVVIPLA